MDSIEILCRLKPLESRQQSFLRKNDTNLMLTIPDQANNKYGRNKKLTYSFSKIYDWNTAQNDFCHEIVSPIINDLFNRKSSLLITYGANDSGKRYTIYGNDNENGLLQTALCNIFNQRESQYTITDALASDSSETEDLTSSQKVPYNKKHRHQSVQKQKKRNHFHSVFLSYAEISNDSVIDLFENLTNNDETKTKDESDSNEKMKNFSEIQVDSVDEALQLIKWALDNRDVLHSDLPISHKILTIKLGYKSFTYSPRNKRANKSEIYDYSKLTLVDLAYQNKSSTFSLRDTESIKSSLMALRNCFEVLKERNINQILKEKSIPYRESRLTWLLKSYFKQKSKIKMILCLNQSISEFSHTCNVLKFANLLTEHEASFNQCPNTSINLDIAKFKSNHPNMSDYYETELEQDLIKENKPASFHRQKNETLLKELDIGSLIDYLNELRQKKSLANINQELVKKIDDLTKDLGDYLGRAENDQKRLSILKDFNNIHEGDSLTRVSTLKTIDRSATIKLSNDSSSSNMDHQRVDNNSLLNRTCNSINTEFRNLDDVLNTKRASIRKLSNQIKSSLRLNKHENFEFHNGLPVANRRGQKRSKSVEVWLDHKPQNITKLDTLMQPLMERKKSVKKIELKDTKRSSKYVLTHQQQDEYGEVVTNLIKGDIIKSPSGGSSVIFTDIERLQLKSPQIPRRRQMQSRGLIEQNPFIIEDRCSVAIEGHPNPRLVRYRTIR